MNITKLRKDFPILSQKIHGYALAYFDNGATTQKPVSVIEAMNKFYRTANANVHRGIHMLSENATESFEEARRTVQAFINARHEEEVIFTSGTTDSINLVAATYCRLMKPGEEILVSELEHHSNILPWQIAANQYRLKLKFAPATADGRLDLKAFRKMLTLKTKLVAITACSNVTGAVTPLKTIIKLAHHNKSTVLVDAAQTIGHTPTDVQKLGCDFLAFSGHKMLGPTGIGVLYGKKEILNSLPPYKSGGSMIGKVTKQGSTYADLPSKFEAGTPPIAEVVGLKAAIDYINRVGFKTIEKQEKTLTAYALKKMRGIPELKLIGPKDSKLRLAVFSFILAGIPDHDLGTLLDRDGIAVRSGHHCAQILHQKFDIFSSTRASLYFYNTTGEIDRLIEALKKIRKIFKG